jgi:hypothetical protein
MIFAIDHLVFSASPSDSRGIRDQLETAGFVPESFGLDFAEIGAASESLSFAGGGFVEFVVELDSDRSPRVWFGETPRLMGLGFSSDDFGSDSDWPSEPESWVMDEDHVLPDGSRLNIHAAGPHQHLSDFYVFVMDRPDGLLQFPPRADGPRLRGISFVGSEADLWRRRLAGWLKLPGDASGLRVGDVALRFQESAEPGLHVSPTFEVDAAARDIELARGRIELAAR